MARKAELVDVGGSHWYKVGKQYLPSVTTHLSVFPKPELWEWKAQVGILSWVMVV